MLDGLKSVYHICWTVLETADDSLYKAQLLEILTSAEAAALRRRLPFYKHDLRPMNDERKDMILHAYDNAVLALYQGGNTKPNRSDMGERTLY